MRRLNLIKRVVDLGHAIGTVAGLSAEQLGELAGTPSPSQDATPRKLRIAVAGAIGYIASGYDAVGLPPWSFGYIYLPAMVGVVAVSMLVAPLGARTAHALPVKQLKRGFGVFLALLALQMLYRLLR